MLNTPVAFLIFNRPETTHRVFAEIARARPRRLLIVADGPRSEADADKCRAARAVIERVDWQCDILTNYSDINLGCKRRISSGLSWVFEQCEEAIVLEDDCLPDPTFFRFCAELLDKYRNDQRIMMISGNNFQSGYVRGTSSYYFSCYTHIWGWASWRRAWQHYDLEMKQWPKLRETGWLRDILDDHTAVKHWLDVLDITYQGSIDSWDIQLMFACWVQSGLTVLPNKNLVSNIGFGPNATHTKSDIYGVANLSINEMEFPLEHPEIIESDREADIFTFNHLFAKERERPGIYRRLSRRLLDSLPGAVRESIVGLRAKWG